MSSSAQIGMVGCVNAIERMQADGEEDRLHARVAELETALKEAQGYVHFCAVRNGPNASEETIALWYKIRDLLEKR